MGNTLNFRTAVEASGGLPSHLLNPSLMLAISGSADITKGSISSTDSLPQHLLESCGAHWSYCAAIASFQHKWWETMPPGPPQLMEDGSQCINFPTSQPSGGQFWKIFLMLLRRSCWN